MLKMHSLLLLLWIFPLALSDCPPNSIKWPDDPPSKCYSIFNTLTSFDKAELACNSAGGHLSSVHSGFENTFLHRKGNSSFTGSTMSDFWIGAKRPTNQNNWTWTDGTPFDFTEWQDDGSGNGQACAAVLLRTGRWNARDCGQLKPYICEIIEVSESTSTNTKLSTTTTAVTTSSQPNCFYPWQYFDNSCYYWSDNANWQNGEAACAKNNSHLVSIHSADEIQFIRSLHNDDFWTGLYTNSTPINWNSTWKYTDNSNFDYSPWVNPFYPSHNGYQCVQTRGLNFTNVDCSTVLNVFCKKPSNNAILTTPSVLTTPKPTGNCLNGWSYNDKTKSCYFVTYAGNFSTLEDYCNMFNEGHLSSFKDYDEFSYVNMLVYGAEPYSTDLWFGLYSDDGALTWKFTDGTPFNYRPWYGGYPVKGGSACANSFDFYQRLTNDSPCSQMMVGVCKMPPLKL